MEDRRELLPQFLPMFSLCIEITASFSSFFCIRKQIETGVALWLNCDVSFLICLRPQENFISYIASSFVFLSPLTWLYLHDLIPKNKAPIVNWPIALVKLVASFWISFLNTPIGRYFWCFIAGSVFTYSSICLINAIDCAPPLSSSGFLCKVFCTSVVCCGSNDLLP